jgi:Regulator of cell morphogenesis and NO signaling
LSQFKERRSQQMSRYSDLQEEYFPNLETYTLAITRAHGKNHPETFKVHELFNKIEAKSQAKEDVSSEYQEIRKLTDNYKIPTDACPTMEKTYNFLSELDQAYSTEK